MVMTGKVKNDADWECNTLKEKIILEESIGEVERERLFKMLWDKRRVLSLDDDDFGGSKLPEFKIILSDDTPIYQRPRHFSPPIAREIEEQCQELEYMGVIERSESSWNSPIVPVRKPDVSL
ncbi:uncharacterized protein [Palaemon carinicauda]|uniref:uncharacterized protein n=1 Tax=Palaemon carinicauda TaxID=392227 RepID=UPI0035B5991C